jgi:putative transposase
MVWTAATREKVGDLGLGARLSDAEYALVARFLPAAKTGGRPSKTDRRLVLDAILHVLRTGCQWRMLPETFPPWQTVYGFFRAWLRAGVLDTALRELRKEARRAAGRDEEPSAAIIDSQSVKTTEKGGRGAMMPAKR